MQKEVFLNMPIDKELQNDIKKGVKLAKPSPAELKARELERKKRLDELEKVKAALGEQEE